MSVGPVGAQINKNLVFGIEQRIKLAYTDTGFVWEEENISPDFTNEGSAAISGHDGELLLYTNGVELFDHFDRVILEGLRTHVSVTQSTLLLRHPSKPLHFILITNDYDALYYTELLRTKGKHDWRVLYENVVLYEGKQRAVGEKLCVVPAATGGYWLITHVSGTNNFVSILIDANGILAPLISTSGPSHVLVTDYSIGNLIPSPKGLWLPSTLYPKENGWLL